MHPARLHSLHRDHARAPADPRIDHAAQPAAGDTACPARSTGFDTVRASRADPTPTDAAGNDLGGVPGHDPGADGRES